MIFKKQVIVPALIAVLVGGLVFAAIQIRKPGPLFSSAHPAGCQNWVDLANEVTRRANVRPIVQEDMYEIMDERQEFIDELNDCTHLICDPIDAQFRQLQNRAYLAELRVMELAGGRDQFLSSHPQPWSEETEAEFERLSLELNTAEDEVIRLNEELEVVEDQRNEMGCNAWEDTDLEQFSDCLEETINNILYCIVDNNPPQYDDDPPVYGETPPAYDRPINKPVSGDATSSDGSVKSVVPKIFNSDKTRSY